MGTWSHTHRICSFINHEQVQNSSVELLIKRRSTSLARSPIARVSSPHFVPLKEAVSPPTQRRRPRPGGGGGRMETRRGKQESSRCTPNAPSGCACPQPFKSISCSREGLHPHPHVPSPPSPNHPSRPTPLLFHSTFQRAKGYLAFP